MQSCRWHIYDDQQTEKSSQNPYVQILFLGCKDSGNSDGSKYFEKRCNDVYVSTKSSAVYRLSIITLAAGIATLLGLIFYAILYQRQAHAGYAGVSRG